ncbi:unnamed protein product [Mycena citricolor]|uniref:PinX1-related protein 1 n=1 Tax=Mycena citricolor TaxID=2018698 RepID=A0AAD2Q6H9_9AGAR|nr:unnamed protein product [Mycena citricolor]
MGLSGRKTKQRIPNDPRNLAWADDAAKFGSSYLAKFGFDASSGKGLGASGEGRTTHIAVSQKLDMLGIGAAQSRDPDGIAWKQNKDFEKVLERLNRATAEDNEPKEENMEEDRIDEDDSKKEQTKKKKRKREDGEEGKAERKRRKSESKSKSASPDTISTTPPLEISVPDTPVPKPLVPRHRAHRARAIAAKNIASKSAAAISEILGLAATPSSSVTPQEAVLTSIGEAEGLEKLTTSSKSMADYFKDKLSTKAKPGASEPVKKEEVDDERPRFGLGAARSRDTVEDAPPKVGLGMSRGMGMLSAMMSGFVSAKPEPVSDQSQTDVVVEEKIEEDEEARRKREKRERKEQRRKDKAEKAQEVTEAEPEIPSRKSSDKKRRSKDKSKETEGMTSKDKAKTTLKE